MAWTPNSRQGKRLAAKTTAPLHNVKKWNHIQKKMGSGGGSNTPDPNGPASNNEDFDNALADQDPMAGWNSYWKGYGLGSAGGNDAFMGSSFQPWFQDTYFNEMRNRWKSEQISAPTADGAGHWLDWLKNQSNLNPAGMRNSWASQSDLTRGVPGRAQSRWMAV
jgi:hypothetical protein